MLGNWLVTYRHLRHRDAGSLDSGREAETFRICRWLRYGVRDREVSRPTPEKGFWRKQSWRKGRRSAWGIEGLRHGQLDLQACGARERSGCSSSVWSSAQRR